MTVDPSTTDLMRFLSKQGAEENPWLCAPGQSLDEWKLTAFLARGGFAEVYAAIRESDGRRAAVKVLARDDIAARQRFEQETQLLAELRSPCFPKLFATGQMDGRPYLVTELLSPVDLPKSERAIAKYLLAVCRATAVLHRAGLIHRDIKPTNIMRRDSGELVLIDLGLVKNLMSDVSPEQNPSIVSGKVVAVGTPRYAAPEQLLAGEATVAVDVHAIGRLADTLFKSNPPRVWRTIIRRATSSIPAQRYPTVEALATAIRFRHVTRHIGCAVILLGLMFLVFGPLAWRKPTPMSAQAIWESLGERVTTNLIEKVVVAERVVTNTWYGMSITIPSQRTYKSVSRQADGEVIRFGGMAHELEGRVNLDPTKEYFVVGPGTLAADLCAEEGMVRLHLKNCHVANRSSVPVDKAGIRYVFEGDAILNFTSLDESSTRWKMPSVSEGFDAKYNSIRFTGSPAKVAQDNQREFEKHLNMEL